MSKFNRVIPVSLIKSSLYLDGELVIWGDRSASDFKTESAYKRYCTLFKGKEFGHNSCGYRYGSLPFDGKSRRLTYHTAKWVLLYNEYPNGMIDHIDGNGFNNNMENLRDVTVSTNNKNARKRKDNTSGVNGVYFDKSKGKWRAQGYTTEHGKVINHSLGYFSCIEAARESRLQWESGRGFTNRHGR